MKNTCGFLVYIRKILVCESVNGNCEKYLAFISKAINFEIKLTGYILDQVLLLLVLRCESTSSTKQ